ncbi:hypothetical protein SLEP1_g60058 [Rubroshorea leprosula]|uniref:RNA-directed DNA polymerase n=1 Tax=Rubroshorea leprosula TaxID=152421 RepID=A0AAV5MYR8_9ROSI|nr:hypothetical protein SLEP1_g60058 [Rubroshorea leprosula]
MSSSNVRSPAASVAGGSRPAAQTTSRPPPTIATAMDVDSDDDDTPTTRPPAFKAAKPDNYYGEREKYDDWVNQMNLYFLMNSVPDDKKTLFATTYLRGRAQHWMKPHLTTYLRGGPNNDPNELFANWTRMEGVMRTFFSISNETSMAERIIQDIRQKGSAADYAAKFQQHAQLTEWNDEALMPMFKRGLKPQVKDHLIMIEQQPQTLGQLITACVEIDDRQWERNIERKNEGRRGGPINYERREHAYRPPPQRRDPNAMDWEYNNVQHPRRHKGKKISSKTYKGNTKKTTECWTCGKQGHMSKDCRSKNKVHRSTSQNAHQVNMIEGWFPRRRPGVRSTRKLRETFWNIEKEQPTQGTKNDKPETKLEEAVDTATRLYGMAMDETNATKPEHVQKIIEHELTTVLEVLGKTTATRKVHQLTKELMELDLDLFIHVHTNSPHDEQLYKKLEEKIDAYSRKDRELEINDEEFWNIELGPESSDEEDDIIIKDSLQPIVEILNAQQDEIINNQGVMNVDKFDLFLDTVRRRFWDWPDKVCNPINLANVLTERPPLGSHFSDGGYTTPEGVTVPRRMREQILALRRIYRDYHNKVTTATRDDLLNDSVTIDELEQIFPRTLSQNKPAREWTAELYPGITISTKGHIRAIKTGDTITIVPKDITSGPLYWELNNIEAPKKQVFITECKINGKKTAVLIDSGASRNFMSYRYMIQNHITTTRKPQEESYSPTGPGGDKFSRVDKETVPVSMVLQQHYEDLVFDVFSMASHDIVLGYPWLVRHNPTIDWKNGVLKFRDCEHVTTIAPGTPDEYQTTDESEEFNNAESNSKRIGKTLPTGHSTGPTKSATGIRQARTDNLVDIPEEPWDHKIPLVPNAKIPFGPLYKQSASELATLKEWIDKMLRKGWIRKSTSQAASPTIQVPKKNGTSRTVIDFRKLNAVTIKNRYPLPNIDEAKDRLIGADWFSKIDLRDAFYALRMAGGEEWKTAFRTRYGLYEFMVMPMGLTNAPASCQELINETLKDLLDECVIAYIDDILIFSKGTLDDHKEDVKKVLTRLSTVDFRTAPEKCEFHVKKIEFLGFIIEPGRISIDPKKIQSITTWPTPNCVKDGKEQQQAFQQLKDACAAKPVLQLFDPEKEVILETDASDAAIGACLTQEHKGKRHPVAYYSRKMTPAEQNYDIHDKELLAIVASLRHWRIYCFGAKKLTIYTDHKNLLFFTTTKELTRRQSRWSELLGEYQFEIKYTPGKENGRADALSRRVDYMDEKSHEKKSILIVNQDGSLSGNFQEFNHVLAILRDDKEEFPISHGKYQVPERQIEDCIKEHHDAPINGHPGVTKTINLIKRNFEFRDMRSRLPGSKDEVTGTTFDSILVVVDKLTKYSHFVPCKESMTAVQLGTLLVDRIARYHGIPESITSDRDKLFTSNYWKTFAGMLGIKQKMSTAFHPQTDGQTERSNQTLEQYLRHYINMAQNNWVQLLPVAQLALNNHVSETTGVSPYRANFGRDPNMNIRILDNPMSEKGIWDTNELKNAAQQLQENIKIQQKAILKNRKTRNNPQLKKGDKPIRQYQYRRRSTTRSKKKQNSKSRKFYDKKVSDSSSNGKDTQTQKTHGNRWKTYDTVRNCSRSSGDTKRIEKGIPLRRIENRLGRNRLDASNVEDSVGRRLLFFPQLAISDRDRSSRAIVELRNLSFYATAFCFQQQNGLLRVVKFFLQLFTLRFDGSPLGSSDADVATRSVGTKTLEATTRRNMDLAHQTLFPATRTLHRHFLSKGFNLLAQGAATKGGRCSGSARHGGRKIVARTQLKEEGGVVLRATPCTIITKLTASTGDTGVT